MAPPLGRRALAHVLGIGLADLAARSVGAHPALFEPQHALEVVDVLEQVRGHEDLVVALFQLRGQARLARSTAR